MAAPVTDTGSRGLGRWRIPRSRGALSGVLLMLLGIWGALIPFIGPAFDFGFTQDSAWTWSSARFWLELLPGLAAFAGGLLLLLSANRATAALGAWLAIAAGTWFIVGPTLAGPLHLGALGFPRGGSVRQAFEWLTFFYGLGAMIVFLGATAWGRLSVRGVRDVAAARQHRERRLQRTQSEAANRDAQSYDPNQAYGAQGYGASQGYTGQGAQPYADQSAQQYGTQGYTDQGAQQYGTQGYTDQGAQPYGTQGYTDQSAQQYGTQGHTGQGAQPYGTQGYADQGAQPYGARGAQGPTGDVPAAIAESEVYPSDRPGVTPDGQAADQDGAVAEGENTGAFGHRRHRHRAPH
ncbi:hypothetical protein MXD59_05640 [Frankia sp. Ag45/Mut15]|uniref:Uncharacterized protein n=1 Tax=Frankia umida TaxID=573489 RepID=A0ABT0JUN3_9ACTN|nr:hypothetical protein [Frankia umida]MCK9875267.1 hypothetical protein [Frankia umida]